jgi:cytidylate kinase
VIVAIDGPAGAGKSAAAREVAFRLGVPYLDTGAMYRCVGLLARRAGLAPPYDERAIERLGEFARTLDVRFAGDPRAQRVAIADEDVTAALRTPEASRDASLVSAVPAVRRELVPRQRELAAATGGVVEGRDIGTVVFPAARFKFFLTASPEVRAQRRFAELAARGVQATWEEVVAEQRERDHRDTSRADSPLVPASDARIVDTSGLTLAGVVEALLAAIADDLDSARRRSV